MERDFRGFTVLESLAKGFGDFQRVSERFQYFSHDFRQFLRFSRLHNTLTSAYECRVSKMRFTVRIF